MQALESLRNPEHRPENIDYPLPYPDRIISLIGIRDCDPERNLGDYQNVGYFLIADRI